MDHDWSQRRAGTVSFATSEFSLPDQADATSSNSSPWRLYFEFRQHSAPGVSQLASLSTALAQRRKPAPLLSIARATDSPVAERSYKVVKVKGDGRCMFRALARGLAYNKGVFISAREEEQDADELRLACQEALCRNTKRRGELADVIRSVETEDSLPRYCKRLQQADFWGGEVELVVLSRMLKAPIFVYLSESQAGMGGGGFVPIAKYGEDFTKKRKPVRLLYSQGNHYDLLLK